MFERFHPVRLLSGLVVVLMLSYPCPALPQIVSQSQLTAEDVDPSFRLTVEHLAQDLRWLGLSPRCRGEAGDRRRAGLTTRPT